jgi:two-component system NtrC family sensor kinase
MKITTKFVLAVLMSTALVFAVNGFLRVRREVTVFQADMVQDARALGQILEKMLADAWRMDGPGRVSQLIADANATPSQMHFRWIPLDATAPSAARLEVDQSHMSTLQQGETVAVTARTTNGQMSLYVYVPVTVDNQIPGVLETVESLSVVSDYIRQTILRTIVMWLGLVVLSGSLLLLIGIVMIGHPMRRVIEKTRLVGMGNLDTPLQFHRRDEFSEVAAALNQMCQQLKTSQHVVRIEMEARLKTLEQLRHANRLKTIGTLVSGIAHELGTPLNVISGRAGLIASGRLSPSDVTDSARIIREQVERMSGIIRQLLNFARRKTPQRVAVDLRALVQQTLDMLESLTEQQCVVPILWTDEMPVQVRLDPTQIQQVLMNLITNAWQAMPQGGQIDIGVYSRDVEPPHEIELPKGRHACVSIKDRGEGISADDLPHIFDPFFTTKDVGQGTGLGLSVAYGIVRDHGGWIDASNDPGSGACFTVYLPMEDEPCPGAS